MMLGGFFLPAQGVKSVGLSIAQSMLMCASIESMGHDILGCFTI
jgi:hypothetical protein